MTRIAGIILMGVLLLPSACTSQPMMTSAQVTTVPVTPALEPTIPTPAPEPTIPIPAPILTLPAPAATHAAEQSSNISYKVEVIPSSAPAGFLIGQLQVDPEEAAVGDNVTISIVVTNTGEQRATYTVVLKLDDAVIKTQDVTIDGGSSRKVEFTVMAEYGEFKVVAGQLAAGLRVFF